MEITEAPTAVRTVEDGKATITVTLPDGRIVAFTNKRAGYAQAVLVELTDRWEGSPYVGESTTIRDADSQGWGTHGLRTDGEAARFEAMRMASRPRCHAAVAVTDA